MLAGSESCLLLWMKVLHILCTTLPVGVTKMNVRIKERQTLNRVHGGLPPNWNELPFLVIRVAYPISASRRLTHALLLQTSSRASTRKGYNKREKRWQFTNGLSDTTEQVDCWDYLARLLRSDNQLDSVEEAASRAINLLPEKGEEFSLCQSHRGLSAICRSKRERKAVYYLEIALEITSAFRWHNQVLQINHALAILSINNARLTMRVPISRGPSHMNLTTNMA
jgi:hypothetical protein